jgi:hypothetical protein
MPNAETRAEAAELLRIHRPGELLRHRQQLRDLLPIEVLAGRPAKPRPRGDLCGIAAAVEARDQFAHRQVAAGVEQLMERGAVEPERRRLTPVSRFRARHVASH